MRLIIFFMALFAMASLQAQQNIDPLLERGSKELGLSGTLDFQDIDELDFDIDASYGYFVADGWEVGGRILGADVGGVERFDLTLFTEYNWNIDQRWVPYAGVSAGIASVDFEDGPGVDTNISPFDDEATIMEVRGGMKYFLQSYMAITGSIAFTVASDDIFGAGDEIEDNVTRFRFGLRYYF